MPKTFIVILKNGERIRIKGDQSYSSFGLIIEMGVLVWVMDNCKFPASEVIGIITAE